MTGTGSGYKGMKYKNFSQQKTRVRILGVAVIVVKQRKKMIPMYNRITSSSLGNKFPVFMEI